MRVLLCGGGTAGHVMPAIAIGEIIEKGFKDSIIAFAGRSGGEENKPYEMSGHRLYTVDICGLKRSLSINNVKTVFKIIKSSRIANKIINDFKPDLIIGTGGYVCYPFIRQGQRLGIKTMLHESNVAPGLVTKLLHKKCECVMLNLEGTKKHLKDASNAIVVGNPVRSDFDTVNKFEARRKLGIKSNEVLILSFGGSLGSEILNRTIGDLISKYTLKNKTIRHIHSTGKSRFDEMKKSFPELFTVEKNVTILPYIDSMPLVLTAADIAITRSGAMTVSELSRSRTPSILIPSPNVTANHQYENAAYLEKLGAAVLIEEKDLNAKLLYEEIEKILASPIRMNEMARRAASACKRDTEKAIIRVIDDKMSKKAPI